MEEIKLSLYIDDILYIENPKYFIQKLPVLINEFSKVTGYMISIQKLAAFLYTNNEISEKKCKLTTPFKVALKNRNEPHQVGKRHMLRTTKH